MGKRALLSCLVLLLAAASAHAEPGVLRVGTSGDYPPFSHARAGAPGGYEGFSIDVARAYTEERGLRLEWVPFEWGRLGADLEAGRFDLAMSGITVRTDRSLLGRFSVPVATSGAVALVRNEGRFRNPEALDRRGVRIAVNAGGHLERVGRQRFPRATLVLVPENSGVLEALVTFAVDAALSDTLESPIWREKASDLLELGPFTRDRKAFLVRADDAELAASLDAWLLARESDGSLAKLRRRHLGREAEPTADPLGALVAAMDQRLALMPWVVAAKRRDVLPIADRAREKRVLAAASRAVALAAQRAGVAPPAEEAVAAFFEAQIEAAKQVQLAAGRAPEALEPDAVPDLEKELRPALLRIGEQIAALLLALPAELDGRRASAALQEGLRSPWLSDASRRELAGALVAVAAAPRVEPPAATPR